LRSGANSGGILVDYESSQLSKKINALQKDIGAKKKARD
jgi:hypothetical protein